MKQHPHLKGSPNYPQKYLTYSYITHSISIL